MIIIIILFFFWRKLRVFLAAEIKQKRQRERSGECASFAAISCLLSPLPPARPPLGTPPLRLPPLLASRQVRSLSSIRFCCHFAFVVVVVALLSREQNTHTLRHAHMFFRVCVCVLCVWQVKSLKSFFPRCTCCFCCNGNGFVAFFLFIYYFLLPKKFKIPNENKTVNIFKVFNGYRYFVF